MFSPIKPPFLGDLLMRRTDKIPTRPSCEIAWHGRLKIQLGFHCDSARSRNKNASRNGRGVRRLSQMSGTKTLTSLWFSKGNKSLGQCREGFGAGQSIFDGSRVTQRTPFGLLKAKAR